MIYRPPSDAPGTAPHPGEGTQANPNLPQGLRPSTTWQGSADGQPKARQRSPALDALRGVAAILMVEQHLGIWLLDLRTHYRALGGFLGALNLAGGLAAPLFVFLAGSGALLAYERNQPLVSRGLRLLALGYLMNALVPSWFRWSSFYVLHLLGAWLVLAAVVLRVRRAWLGVALMVLVLSVLAQNWLRVPPALTNDWMNRAHAPLGLAGPALVQGHFPVLPWLAFGLLGAWGMAAQREGSSKRLFGGAAALLSVGGLMALLPSVAPRLGRVAPYRYVLNVSFYPASTAFCLLAGGACLGVFGLALGLERSKRLPTLAWLERLGQTSLSLLFVHVVVFREVFGRLGWSRSLSPWATLGAIGATLACWSLGTRAWQRSDYRFGLEWLLRARS